MAKSKEEQPAPTIVQNFTASGNSGSQINQGTINNPTFNYNADSEAIFQKLASLLQKEAANNDIDLDVQELQSVTDEIQEAYDDPETTEDTAKPIVSRFKAFIDRYADNLLPICGKAALALLATAVSGNPVLSLVVAVLQEAIPQ